MYIQTVAILRPPSGRLWVDLWTRGPGQVGSREVSRCLSDGSE